MEKLFVTLLRVSDPPPGMHKASLLACGSQGGHSLNVPLTWAHVQATTKGPAEKGGYSRKVQDADTSV